MFVLRRTVGFSWFSIHDFPYPHFVFLFLACCAARYSWYMSSTVTAFSGMLARLSEASHIRRAVSRLIFPPLKALSMDVRDILALLLKQLALILSFLRKSRMRISYLFLVVYVLNAFFIGNFLTFILCIIHWVCYDNGKKTNIILPNRWD